MLRNSESIKKTSSLRRILSKRRNILAILAVLVVVSIPVTVYAASGVTEQFSNQTASIPVSGFYCNTNGLYIKPGVVDLNVSGTLVAAPQANFRHFTMTGHGNFTYFTDDAPTTPNATGFATFSANVNVIGSPTNPSFIVGLRTTFTNTGPDSSPFTYTLIGSFEYTSGGAFVLSISSPNCGTSISTTITSTTTSTQDA